MSWFVEIPSLGRWLLTLGVSAVFLLVASSLRRRTAAGRSYVHEMLGATGHMLAYLVLTLLWMWTLEPVQVELVRVSMSLALALGLGSLTHLQSAGTRHRQVSVVNTAGLMLGMLALMVLVSY